MLEVLTGIVIAVVVVAALIIGGGAFSKEQKRADSDIDHQQWWARPLRELVESWRAGRS